MAELFFSTMRNIGLGVFVNGAYAWQFTEAWLAGAFGTLEGVIIMALAIYIERITK